MERLRAGLLSEPALLVACLFAFAAAPLCARLPEETPEPGQASPSEPAAAERSVHVDTFHGVQVPDPYRWLEALEAPATRRWVEAEDARARRFAAEFHGREEIRSEVARLADVRRFLPPWKGGDRYFYLSFQSSGGPGTPGTRLHMRETLDAPGRTLIGEQDLPEGVVLTRAVPGPAGRLVAYGTAPVGSSWETIRILDVESGRTLPGRVEGVNGGGSTLVWRPDGGGFFYERFDRPPAGEERTARLLGERVLYHPVSDAKGRDRWLYDPDSPEVSLTTGIGGDGRHLVIAVREPTAAGNRVLYADLEDARAPFRTLVSGDDATYSFVGSRGSTLLFQTDGEAPNGRVVAVDVADHARTGTLRWHEVIPQGEEAINSWLGARMVGPYLVVGYLVDARTETRVFDLSGDLLYALELPRLGSVWSGFNPTPALDETETFYSLSGLADPGSIYRLDLATGRSGVVLRSELGYDPAGLVTRQVFYPSRDGKRIPMYLVHAGGLQKEGRAPVILYGYGFGAWSAAPWFQPHLAAWVRMGGIWALPNIRGGGEYGEPWHRAGRGRNKQTSIDDYVAAAEWLIEQGYTSPRLLVLNASSAGGAVGGGALVQRPELFGAAVLDYPVLDMLRYHRFTRGGRWRSEFGTVEDPQDFRALLAYSPYHNVRLNRCYPATLVAPGERDEVTPPLHAYKFVASLQEAQSCDEPVLLRVTWGAGHSSGATTADAVETWTDQLSFLLRTLGVDLD